ncbi:MAG: c-type cytochrome [Phycisphaerales bacterium]|nr:MAG: c-type cytochrome [Phycisphaerales bacterium]
MDTPRQAAAFTVVFLAATVLSAGPSRSQANEYRSPVSVIAGPEGQLLYIAQATADRVAVFDPASERVDDEIAVAEYPVGLALSVDGQQLYVTSATPEGTVQVIDLRSREVIDRIAAGHTPVALVASPDGATLYVCNQFSNNVGVVDLTIGEQVATIAVPREPVAAAPTSDGRFLFVANHLPAGPANTDYTACVVSVIDTEARELFRNIELPDGSTNLQDITISPDGRYAYVTHLLGRYKFPVTYLERGWVNTNALTIIDVPEQTYVNTVLLDDPTQGAANPHGVVCTDDGAYLIVSHAGTHELSVIARAGLHARLLAAGAARDFVSTCTSTSGRRFTDPSYTARDIPNDLTFMSGIRRRVKLAGNGLRGLVVIGSTVYAAEYFSDSIGIIDIDPGAGGAGRSVALGEPTPMTTVRQGEMLFHDASHSFQRWHSCSSCHSGGARVCALNWDLLNDGMLNAKNTKSLLLTHETPPAMATGVRANAEEAVRSGIYFIQLAAPRRPVREALNAYLKSLEPVPSPYLVQGPMSDAASRGAKVFQTAGCAQCHAGPLFIDGLRHRVGTETEEEPRGRFDTPTLIEVWRTAPYLHDGRAETVRDVLTTFNPNDKHGHVSTLSEDEIADLVEYVLTR